ncbi:uncharacterized mitochondrial protein AtMg00820-like [Tripterygium wilfordii]|uniref:uncharacterized mitochondrial protein AtMg00820-like n=1 Tax=Tripterygium wilfordii TaxID=458696 RepID=UPI0018F7F0E4|nr:uncharacterized mitochondrial protein AtMg00820-like [Tripterygium wilfordii]
MQSEFNALLQHQTWTLVEPTPDMKLIQLNSLFRVKQNPNGSIAHYKARLLAQGFAQRPGVDYKNTFSPVIKLLKVDSRVANSIFVFDLVFDIAVSYKFLFLKFMVIS